MRTPLRRLLLDPEPWVRMEALLTLAEHHPRAAIQRVSGVDMHALPARAREAFAGALATVAGTYRSSVTVASLLRRGVRDRNPAVRSWSLLGMSFMDVNSEEDLDFAQNAGRYSRSFEVRLEAMDLLADRRPEAARRLFRRELPRLTLPPGIAFDLARRLAEPSDRHALTHYWRRLSRRERSVNREAYVRLRRDLRFGI